MKKFDIGIELDLKPECFFTSWANSNKTSDIWADNSFDNVKDRFVSDYLKIKMNDPGMDITKERYFAEKEYEEWREIVLGLKTEKPIAYWNKAMKKYGCIDVEIKGNDFIYDLLVNLWLCAYEAEWKTGCVILRYKFVKGTFNLCEKLSHMEIENFFNFPMTIVMDYLEYPEVDKLLVFCYWPTRENYFCKDNWYFVYEDVKYGEEKDIESWIQSKFSKKYGIED